MGYAKEIGTALAEMLEEMVLSEDTGVPLNEIRDLNSLQAAMSKFGKRHPHSTPARPLLKRKKSIAWPANGKLPHLTATGKSAKIRIC
jgi:hypothetical protein